MSDGSPIEWLNRPGTKPASWNPVRGCSRISTGCGGARHEGGCYAEKIAARFSDPDQPFHGFAERTSHGGRWTGKLALVPEKLTEPLSWRTPRTIFVNSMSDLFHENLPDEAIDQVFAVMALTPQHTHLVLTKRADRMREYVSDEMAPFRIARAIDALRARRDAGQEEILPIAGYPGYFASSHGFIYSERRGKRRRMSPDIGEQGHQRVQLYKGDGVADRLLVHRLILETFIGPAPTPDAQGRHRDGVPSNNALSNLVWGDQGENWDDARRHGTHRRYSKLSPGQAADIRRRHAAGASGEALAREYDVSATQIRNIASGKQWATVVPIEWPLPGVWLGVSAERQQEADERIPLLLQTPAAVRFVSLEPLLGAVDLESAWHGENALNSECWGDCGWCDAGYTPLHNCRDHDHSPYEGRDKSGLDWVIVGGESGPNARPFDIYWAECIVAQCKQHEVACFVKQLGSNPVRDCTEDMPEQPANVDPADLAAFAQQFIRPLALKDRKGGDPSEWPHDLRVREFPDVKQGRVG